MKKENNTVILNKKAKHDYTVLNTLECGIALQGHEVKSICNGMCSIKEAWCEIQNGNLVLVNAHITKYEKAMDFDCDEKRDRQLLAHKAQIRQLASEVKESGVTLIPLNLHFANHKCKVTVGICKGKHAYDKRQTLKDRDVKRQIARELA